VKNPLQGVNVLALVVVITAAILTGMGKVDPESFLLLVTGLAIPARSDGYQAVGTAPRQVEVVNEPNNPVPVEGDPP
jgi:hypothetical protein